MIRNQLGHPVKIVKLLSQNRVEVQLVDHSVKLIRHISEIREDKPGELKKALQEHDETKTLFNFDDHERVELTEEGQRAVRQPVPVPPDAEGAQASDEQPGN